MIGPFFFFVMYARMLWWCGYILEYRVAPAHSNKLRVFIDGCVCKGVIVEGTNFISSIGSTKENLVFGRGEVF